MSLTPQSGHLGTAGKPPASHSYRATVLAALFVTAVTAPALHFILKGTVAGVIESQEIPSFLIADVGKWEVAALILNSGAVVSKFKLTDDPDAGQRPPETDRAKQPNSILYLPTYLDADVTPLQVAAALQSFCASGNDPCYKDLLRFSRGIVTTLKESPPYIFYRMTSGWFQLGSLYFFVLAVLVLIRRYKESKDRLHFHHHPETVDMRTPGERAQSVAMTELPPNFYFSDYLYRWEKQLVNDKRYDRLEDQVQNLGRIYFFDYPEIDTAEIARRKASMVRDYLRRIAGADAQISSNPRNLVKREYIDCVVQVVRSFLADQAVAGAEARAKADATLEHFIDRIASGISRSRDLFKCSLEIIPVIGFFGTVWGLSLAMIRAGEVLRAQSDDWTYDAIFAASVNGKASEKQVLALDGMLNGLGVAFDTTGFALALLFFLLPLGVFVSRREDRMLTEFQAAIFRNTVSALPVFGRAVPEPENGASSGPEDHSPVEDEGAEAGESPPASDPTSGVEQRTG